MLYDDVKALIPMDIPEESIMALQGFVDSAAIELMGAGIPMLDNTHEAYPLYTDLISRMVQPKLTGYYNTSAAFDKLINTHITLLKFMTMEV